MTATTEGADPLSLLLNTRLGDYLATSLIKKSGQAAVFKARNLVLDTEMALKVYGPFERLGDVGSALKDAKRQAKIGHSAVLQVHTPFDHEQVFEGDSLWYLCIPMPFSARGTCEGWPRFRDPLRGEHLDDLMHLFAGVKAIHDGGLTHNDLKPANILLFDDGPKVVMKITDFGIARSEGPLAGRLYQLTPPYAPPEQFDGDSSPAGDVYSLGATLYYLLTGRHPFELPAAASPNDWKRVHLESPRPDATLYHERCPVRLALLIMQMTAPAAVDRPRLELCIATLERIAQEIIGDTTGYKAVGSLKKLVSSKGPTAPYGVSTSKKLFAPKVHRTFGRDLWLIQIRLPTNGWNSLVRTLGAAVHYFSECFSVVETYGPYDLLVRVWSSRTRKEEFKDRVIRDGAIEVDWHRVGDLIFSSYKEPIDDLRRTGAVALQENVEPFATNLRGYVVRNYGTDGPSGLKAFTFVEPRSGEDRTRRDDLLFRFRHALNDLPAEASACLYSFTSECRYLCMIEFSCDRFEEIWKVPSLIVEGERGDRFRTSTLLATKRLVFESDQIRL
jgi:serine/threonine protein kinase